MSLRAIRHNFMKLCLNLDLNDFLAKCLENKSISDYDYQYLYSFSRLRRNQEFLLSLDMYGEDCHTDLIQYIKTTEIKISENFCCEKPTTSNFSGNRYSYTKIHSLLISKINASLIAIRLYESEEIDGAQLEQVLTQTTRLDRSRTLCILIERRASRPGFLSSFITSLRNEQPDLHKQVMTKLLIG